MGGIGAELGIRRLCGITLAQNTEMSALGEVLGFSSRRLPGSPTLTELTLRLPHGAAWGYRGPSSNAPVRVTRADSMVSSSRRVSKGSPQNRHGSLVLSPCQDWCRILSVRGHDDDWQSRVHGLDHGAKCPAAQSRHRDASEQSGHPIHEFLGEEVHWRRKSAWLIPRRLEKTCDGLPDTSVVVNDGNDGRATHRLLTSMSGSVLSHRINGLPPDQSWENMMRCVSMLARLPG